MPFLKVMFGLAGVTFLMAPLLAIMPLAFNGGAFLTYPLDGVSLRWFEKLVTDDAWRLAIFNSLVIGAASSVVATALGTLASLGLRHLTGPVAALSKMVFILPMATPAVVLGVGMQLVFGKLGLNSSYAGMIFGHAVLSIPFVVLSVMAALAGIDAAAERAAESLGATRLKVMWFVTLPMAMPGIVTGLIFAFANSLDEVVLTLFLAGPNQRTIAREMFIQLRDNLTPALAAAAFAFIVATLLIGVVGLWMKARRAKAMRPV